MGASWKHILKLNIRLFGEEYKILMKVNTSFAILSKKFGFEKKNSNKFIGSAFGLY